MKTVARTPSNEAASATPWAWLPALAATTPAARSPSDSPAIRTYAPRSLKDPVRWRFSHLKSTGLPTREDRWRLPSRAVIRATPDNVLAALRTVSSVTESGWSSMRPSMAFQQRTGPPAPGLPSRGTGQRTSAYPSDMPTSVDMTTIELYERLQHEVALFARRAEQTRLGGVGKARNSMDRAAYLLLNRLDREGPMGVKALAEGMGIDSSTVTRQVAPLVESGLVKRTSHPEDGRAVVLALSPRGEARLAEVRASRRALMAVVTEDWNSAEREAFCELLSRFNVGLSEHHATVAQGD